MRSAASGLRGPGGWLPGRRVRFWQAPSRTALRGARRSVRPMPGIGEGRSTVLARTRRAPPPRPRQTAREVMTRGACRCWRDCGCSPARAPARRCRPVPPATWARRPVRSWPKRTPPGARPWPPLRKAAGTRRPCSWRPGRPGWRPPQTTSPRRLRTGAPRRCRGTRAGSRPSPQRCGRCRPRSAPRRIAAPGRRISQHRLPDTPAGLRTRQLDLQPCREASHGRT